MPIVILNEICIPKTKPKLEAKPSQLCLRFCALKVYRMSNKIGNDDIRALQSLELFNNWLAKHPYLKYTGDGMLA